MIYKIEQGEKSWADDAMRKRGTLKKPKAAPPSFCPSLMFYWDSFWSLSSCRHELNPIPWTALNEYCLRWRILDPQEFDQFVFFLNGIDSAFLNHKHAEIKRKRAMKTTK